MGVEFAGRGRRADGAIRVMRALWSGERSFEGRFWSFRDATAEPHPSPQPQIWGRRQLGACDPAGARARRRLAPVARLRRRARPQRQGAARRAAHDPARVVARASRADCSRPEPTARSSPSRMRRRCARSRAATASAKPVRARRRLETTRVRRTRTARPSRRGRSGRRARAGDGRSRGRAGGGMPRARPAFVRSGSSMSSSGTNRSGPSAGHRTTPSAQASARCTRRFAALSRAHQLARLRRDRGATPSRAEAGDGTRTRDSQLGKRVPSGDSSGCVRELRAREPGGDRRRLTSDWVRANHAFHDVSYRVADAPFVARSRGARCRCAPAGRRAAAARPAADLLDVLVPERETRVSGRLLSGVEQ